MLPSVSALTAAGGCSDHGAVLRNLCSSGNWFKAGCEDFKFLIIGEMP